MDKIMPTQPSMSIQKKRNSAIYVKNQTLLWEKNASCFLLLFTQEKCEKQYLKKLLASFYGQAAFEAFHTCKLLLIADP